MAEIGTYKGGTIDVRSVYAQSSSMEPNPPNYFVEVSAIAPFDLLILNIEVGENKTSLEEHSTLVKSPLKLARPCK